MTKIEIEELYAFNIPLCVKAKCANKNMSIELTNSLFDLYPEYTLKQHKLAAPKLLNKLMKAIKEFNFHPDDIKQMRVKANQKERDKQANDEVYKAKRRLCKSASALKQRLANSPSNIKKNATAKLVRAALTLMRLNPKAITCVIETKGICLRKGPKKFRNQGKICPMQDKYCFEDGKCYPLKKKG
jgi:hypothetical protein